jgi:hypothetical protein
MSARCYACSQENCARQSFCTCTCHFSDAALLERVAYRSVHYEAFSPTPGGPWQVFLRRFGRTAVVADCPTEEAARAALRLLSL